MTIGIGFKCTDGVVLATDTQITRGGIKTRGPKLFPLFLPMERDDVSILIAGAGCVGFMRRAIEKIESGLAGVKNPGLEDVRMVAEEVLTRFYQDHVYPSPDPVAMGFDLLLGVWSRRDNDFALFETEATTVSSAVKRGDGYSCIGEGIYVSEYALGLTYHHGVNVESAKFLAALCIKAAKDYVGTCGGRTHIWSLKDDGSGYYSHRVLPTEVTDAEQYSEELFETLRYLMECLDGDTRDDKSIEALVMALKDSIVSFREKQKAWKDRKRKMEEQVAEWAAKQRSIGRPI